MNRFYCFAMLLSIFVSCCTVTAAAVPTYQPYGAWRGRIRYVEGPFRTRSTIHWGSGVTPAGAQVLMHGLTVAGDVFSNPNTLGALAGRSADVQRGIDDEWRNIRATEDELMNKLNELEESAGLSPTSDIVKAPTTSNPAVTTLPGSEVIRDELNKMNELVSAVKAAANKYFEAVNANDMSRWQFVAVVLGKNSAPTGSNSHMQLATEWSDFQKKFKALDEKAEAAKTLINQWKLLIAEDDRQQRAQGSRPRYTVATGYIQRIEQVLTETAKWKEKKVD